MLALAPGTLLAGIAGGIVFPIFPVVGLRVGLSLTFIGAILAANRAARLVSAPFIGVLADRIGARRTMLLGLAVQVVVIAMYLAGMVWHLEGPMFLIGRVVHGVGSGCVFIAASALSLQASGDGRGATAGTVRAAIVLGVPIGFIAGGLLGDAVGDTWTFAIAEIAVILALIGASITVPDLRVKLAKRAGLMDSLHAVKDVRLLAVGALNFATNLAASGVLLATLPLLVATRHLEMWGRDAEGSAGILMSCMSLVDAAATGTSGRLGDRWSHAKVAACGIAIACVGLLVVGWAETPLHAAVGIGIVGLGIAGLGPSVLVLMSYFVPPERRGTGSGVLQLCGDAGGMIGPLLGTALLAHGTALPYVVSAIALVCFAPAALWLDRHAA